MPGKPPAADDIDARYGLEPVFEPGAAGDAQEQFVELGCPWCGETLTLCLDLSAGEQSYVEDCQVCCQPMVVSVSVDGEGQLREVGVQREGD